MALVKLNGVGIVLSSGRQGRGPMGAAGDLYLSLT